MRTARATRAVTSLAAAVAVGATGGGCGVIAKVKDVAGNVQTLTELADKLKDSTELTYTADYRTADGRSVRLVRQPPRSAYLGPDGAYITAPDATLLCRAATCQKAPPHGDVAITDAPMLSTVTGKGFVPPSLAIGLLAAAALYPEATVRESTGKAAGKPTRCAAVTDLPSTPGGDATGGPLTNFTVCITDEGVLGSFQGTLQDGTGADVTLTGYSTHTDSMAFSPPPDAAIIPVSQLAP
jgi:hypothetical protein